MAIVYLCDGCETAKEKSELTEKGIMGNVYCAECVETVSAFLSDRDTLHDEVQKKWDKGIAALYKKYHTSLGFTGKLPDELES